MFMSVDRRQLLKGALLSAATGTLASMATSAANQALAAERTGRPWDVIDTNISLFRWPFRRLPYDNTTALVEKLQSLGIQQAWAGSFECLLQRDIASVNERLAEACRRAPSGLLTPFGCVNPTLPDWEDDLRRCHDELGMPGIRLHPNYHGYSLDDARFKELLGMAREFRLLVQLAVSMEDTRTQIARLQTADVDLKPLPGLLHNATGPEVMLLNYKPRGEVVRELAQAERITFDVARVEGTDGIARLMQATSPQRVCFGTHAPFFIYEAALIKVYESQLPAEEIRQLLAANAKAALQRCQGVR